MPIIGILLPFESSYKKWSLNFYGKEIPIGAFLGDVATFIIISFVLFILIKKVLIILFEIKNEEEQEMTLEQKTLLEIKDLIKGLADKHS